MFFRLPGFNGTLTPFSAVVGDGSTILFDTEPPPDTTGAGTVVGGEWAYNKLYDDAGGTVRGIGSAGLGLFGVANFPGANLYGQEGVDGVNYGIISQAGAAGGNTAVTGQFPLVKSSVFFTLSGLPDNYVLPQLLDSDVTFQFGTALSEPSTPGGPPGVVPEPTTMIAGALLLLPFGMSTMRALRRRAA